MTKQDIVEVEYKGPYEPISVVDQYNNDYIALNQYEAGAVLNLIDKLQNGETDNFDTGDWYHDLPEKIKKWLNPSFSITTTIPEYLIKAFPNIEFRITKYGIPTPWYEHRREIHFKTKDGLTGKATMSSQLIADSLKNEALQEMVVHRIKIKIEREKEEKKAKECPKCHQPYVVTPEYHICGTVELD